MDQFTRYAIYYAPRPGAFADATAQWLGWDAQAGRAVPQPDASLAAQTAVPRKYGFHGTLKAPFRLASHSTQSELMLACAALADSLAPVTMDGLHLGMIDGFLALTPKGDTRALNRLAAQVVQTLEPFRAPLTDAEIARRNPAALTPRQRGHLLTYGYPYVLEDFKFHLTLTGSLSHAGTQPMHHAAQHIFAPYIAGPFHVQDLCLFGEDAVTGPFHLIHRYPLNA